MSGAAREGDKVRRHTQGGACSAGDAALLLHGLKGALEGGVNLQELKPAARGAQGGGTGTRRGQNSQAGRCCSTPGCGPMHGTRTLRSSPQPQARGPPHGCSSWLASSSQASIRIDIMQTATSPTHEPCVSHSCVRGQGRARGQPALANLVPSSSAHPLPPLLLLQALLRASQRTPSGRKNSQMHRKPLDSCVRPSGRACWLMRLHWLMLSYPRCSAAASSVNWHGRQRRGSGAAGELGGAGGQRTRAAQRSAPAAPP